MWSRISDTRIPGSSSPGTLPIIPHTKTDTTLLKSFLLLSALRKKKKKKKKKQQPLEFPCPALSLQQLRLLLWCGFSPWLGNFHMLRVWPKSKKQLLNNQVFFWSKWMCVYFHILFIFCCSHSGTGYTLLCIVLRCSVIFKNCRIFQNLNVIQFSCSPITGYLHVSNFALF